MEAISAKPEIGAHFASFNFANKPICTDASTALLLKQRMPSCHMRVSNEQEF
jgi:hypothetical protein